MIMQVSTDNDIEKTKGNSCIARIAFLFFMAMTIFLSGCGKKEGDEPTKYMSQAGLEKLTREAADKAAKQGA